MNNSVKLHLIRHGQSLNNALPEYQRVEDPCLTDLGERQAACLADWAKEFRPSRLLVSPFRRTLQTARPLHHATGLPCEIWANLHERGGCYAGYQPSNFQGRPGMSGRQILKAFPEAILVDEIGEEGWWKSQPRETDDEARCRASEIIRRLIRTFASTDEVVACVMHADFKNLVVADLMNREVEPGVPAIYRNASVTCFDFKSADEHHLERENCVQHLSPDLL